MKNDNLQALIQNYLDGKIDETQMFEAIKGLPLEYVKDQFAEAMEVDFLLSKKYMNSDSQKAFETFLSTIKPIGKIAVKPKKSIPSTFFNYAALIIGLLGIGLVLFLILKSDEHDSLIHTNENTVNLHLTDGLVEKLDEPKTKEILNTEGKVIAIQTNGKIIYKGIDGITSTQYNELEVPYGKRFELELSDGTTVYLNSGSSIKFPVNFIENQIRKVYLTGEAFFKVVKDVKSPFIVNAGGVVNVRVLGTEFNVSAYSDDLNISTVLVSGGVQLCDSLGSDTKNTKMELLPGNRGMWSKEYKEFKIDKVDTSIHTSWVKNKLIFRDSPFSEIRKKLERHYNVSIVNTNAALDDNTFNANFSHESIEEILEILDRTYGIDYEILGKQIIIK
ncbi:DUF4974 domain-containing protein [Arenibacter sp. M-2]|uniref:FecR family protein n=1 Tax=Arenibacter sp. M-2 TaxID=3053612 RepID=UPI0025700E1A|nr:FecR domain-containing protein [Arenibacter sp. M-2]MDL5513953.1 DUF4974 domain-containing protein [Arenibacter sp. M-2]